MDQDLVLVSIDNGVGTVKLNRTAARNALSIGMTETLSTALDRLDQDRGVKVVLLTSVAVPCLLGLTAAALWLPGSAIARALVQGIR